MSKSIKSQGIKARPLIMAASAAALAVVGSLYGAGLKERQEMKQVWNSCSFNLNRAQNEIKSLYVRSSESKKCSLIKFDRYRKSKLAENPQLLTRLQSSKRQDLPL